MLAPAKINLDLRITGRREDGYHLLDSIVVFTELGDELTANYSNALSLKIDGPFANDLRPNDGNLVLKAAKELCAFAGVRPDLSFNLIKNLPVSSGIGGGSADAAAAIKLTNELLGLKISNEDLNKVALKIGADVPVCLVSKSSRMTGIGENITPVLIKTGQPILIVNPQVAVSTPEVFQAFRRQNSGFFGGRQIDINNIHWSLMLDHIKGSSNDLQEPACLLNDEIKTVLDRMNECEGVIFKRMSGSGATCFALFEDQKSCLAAAKHLRNSNNHWWIRMSRIL